jgi:hypothetical protein
MENYLTAEAAIFDMHQKGYINDFQLIGNDLLWVQEKIFIRSGDFSILECHRLYYEPNGEAHIIVFGIIAHGYDAKGILLNHYAGYTSSTPEIIRKKIIEMHARSGNQCTGLDISRRQRRL